MDPSCAMRGVEYLPFVDLVAPSTWANDARSCQLQCAAHPKCWHFTFFRELGSCHLLDGAAMATRGSEGALSGPPHCEETVLLRRFLQRGLLGSNVHTPKFTLTELAGVAALLSAFVAVVARRRPTSGAPPQPISGSQLLPTSVEETQRVE